LGVVGVSVPENVVDTDDCDVGVCAFGFDNVDGQVAERFLYADDEELVESGLWARLPARPRRAFRSRSL
jgi:hypothetical protein